MNEKIVYWNKEVADLLKIGDSTLRKWCILLEERGYVFLKDEQNRRGFRDKDVVLLRRFRDLLKQGGASLENAANAVILTDEAVQETNVVPIEKQERHSFYENEVREHLQKQEQFNQTLLERLDKQQEHYETLLKKQQNYIENAIQARDERLIQAVREIQETRLLLAAAEEEERKNKKWWKFWK